MTLVGGSGRGGIVGEGGKMGTWGRTGMGMGDLEVTSPWGRAATAAYDCSDRKARSGSRIPEELEVFRWPGSGGKSEIELDAVDSMLMSCG